MPASNYLVGTAPDQVPSNADLGEMAFQSKDAVEFTGGKGGLSHLDITAISAQLNVNATDVFVYDTSKDSDGGAWRNRCQHTSWFNEELNTATRGARREFPAVAVIVATTTNITIYDGDSPDLPMWMVFVGGSAGLASTLMLQNGNYFSVAAMNGVLVTGVHTNTDNWGSPIINFISEKVVRMDPNTTEGGAWLGGGIAERNLQKGYASYAASGAGYLIVDSRITDVAITLLPNAPIDAATGLPVPTIAVATEGGASVINNDGLVANFTNEDPSYNATRYIQFNQKKQLQFVMDAVQRYLRTFNPPFAARTVSQWGAQYDDGITVGLEIPQFTANASYIRDIAENAIGTDLGVEVFSENTPNPAASLYAYIAAKYNSGWLIGDTKGAWLSDTTQETMVGAGLITNGTFQTDTSGWTISNASEGSIAVSNGQLVITNSNTSDPPVFCWQAISTVVGKTYTLSADLIGGTVAMLALIASTSNTTAGTVSNVASSSATTLNNTFTATASTMYVLLRVNANSVGTVIVDNVSCRLADPDRTYFNKGLQVFGNIAKTPVAAGADLVAYSGFSASNYLEQPYNSGLDFGTGDFFVAGWVNPSYSAGNHIQYYICNRATASASGARWEVRLPANVEWFRFYINDGTTTAYIDSVATAPPNAWTHFCAVRRNGRLYMYVNGADSSTGGLNTVGSYNLTNTSAKLWVGNEVPGSSTAAFLLGGISMLRISATAPSGAQIKKMYEDEKYLFQDNAKATLYGASDAVTALAYDEDTQLLHVGTSSGRSVFDGLRRVDNTTTAVSATISAANGLVVEN